VGRIGFSWNRRLIIGGRNAFLRINDQTIMVGNLAMFRRFTLTTDFTTLVAHFNLKEMPPFSPSYNIAPGDRVATLSATMDLPPRDIRMLDWGFIFDDKDVKLKEDRVATVREDELAAPRYLSLLRFKRCLILADGLYVWQSETDVPRYLVRPDRQPFAFAGIREHFASGENKFDTCAVITAIGSGGGASAQAMPALVGPQDYDQWLSPMLTKVQRIGKLIIPLTLGEMESRAVGDQVKDASDKLSHCTDLRSSGVLR
jgi:putative SOS response-associated peptidase YedK